MKKSIFLWLSTCCLVLSSWFAHAQALPQTDNVKHLGVASCAASMCHGSAIARTGSDVLQNEYVTWSKHDSHAQAYQTLLTPESKSIAKKLGLKNAHQAGVCLDCHADNVKKEHQGEKFQISDGVSCESCHGGGENYITSHTDAEFSRQHNIDNGLYPSDQPKARAQLCLSCHLGNQDKFASHDIMGAGHPRLAFELDTFGILQPLHYVVDEDYQANKWHGNSYATWFYGQLEASRATLELLKTKLLNNTALFPEIALFDCHSCHHEMDDIKWTKTKGQGFKPGTVRINDGNLKMLMAMASNTMLSQELHQNIQTVRHALNDKTLLVKAIDATFSTIEKLEAIFVDQNDQQRMNAAQQVLTKIIEMGIGQQFSDYIAAEQAVMAVDLLIASLEKTAVNKQQIEQLYQLVEHENSYDAAAFSALMKALK